jgi:uncharacterized protein YhjY with autotransporter beta-barrel domain
MGEWSMKKRARGTGEVLIGALDLRVGLLREVPKLLLCVALGVPLAAMGQTSPAPPTVAALSFSPSSIASGSTSKLTIALGNSNSTAATLTQTLTDVFPTGVMVAAPTVGGNCTSALVSAGSGGTSVSYQAGATIPAGGCSFTVTVKATSTSKTYYTNTIPAGALVTTVGTSPPLSSPTAASATLTVLAPVAVPNVVGLSQAAAATALQAAGLVVGTVTKSQGPTQYYNEVYQQSPAAGTSVGAGTAVALTISTGSASNPNSPLTSANNSLTPSQASTAAAVERVCFALKSSGAVGAAQHNLFANCSAIIGTYGGGSNPTGLANSLDAVSGKQNTGQTAPAVKFGGAQFSNITTRLAAIQGGLSGSGLADLDLGLPGGVGLADVFAMLKDAFGISVPSGLVGGASGDDAAYRGVPSRWGFFLNGNLVRGTQDTTANETGYDFRSNGVTGGVDYRFNDHMVAGIAYSHFNGDSNFVDDSARLDAHSNLGSLYASYYNQALYVDLIATYGHISYDETRTTTFTIDPTLLPTLPTNCTGAQCTVDVNGSTGARQVGFGGSMGYGFHSGGLQFGPELAVNWTRIDVDGFTENDPSQSGMALSYGSQTGESLLLKAGGNLSYAISTSFGVIMPSVRAHYIHEFKNNQRAMLAHFVSDPTINSPNGPTSSFTIYTDLPDRDYFDYAAGITMVFRAGVSAFLDYNALAGQNNIHAHQFAVGIRFQPMKY